MNYAIQHISRLIDDAENIGGMRVGMPKAHVDTSLLRHVIIHFERLEAENIALKARVEAIQTLVNEQAEDEGLWFVARTAPEGYLQQELRRLHAAIEGERHE